MRGHGYRCEYCEGMVQPRRIERKAFKHKKGLVIMCDVCGNPYWSADVLHRAREIATGQREPERTGLIPVALAGQEPQSGKGV